MDAKVFILIVLSQFFMQLEISAVCFGLSAFIKKGGMAIGMGITFIFYFMNIIANLTKELEFLKNLTPYGYTDSAPIINEKVLNTEGLCVGAVFFIAGIVLSYVRYTKKDIL